MRWLCDSVVLDCSIFTSIEKDMFLLDLIKWFILFHIHKAVKELRNVKLVEMKVSFFVYLFVWLFVVSYSNVFSFLLRRHHYRWRTATIDLYWPCMTIDLWKFFSVPRLLWHWTSVYSGHLRRPGTPMPVADSLHLKLSLRVLISKVCRASDLNTYPSTCEANL